MKRQSNNNFFAFALILIGILLIFKTFNLPFLENFNLGFIIGMLWPMFLIIPGLNMLKNRVNLGGIIVTLLGVSFLLDNFLEFYNIDFELSIFKFFWPIIFIYIGFKILSSNGKVNFEYNNHSDQQAENYDENSTHYDKHSEKAQSITFSSRTFIYDQSSLKEGITRLNLNISFGGAEIIVDEGIQVILIGHYTFGGHEFFGKDAGGLHNEVKEVRYLEDDETTYERTLLVNSNITFGGLEIRKR